jgi:hypothetical protein
MFVDFPFCIAVLPKMPCLKEKYLGVCFGRDMILILTCSIYMSPPYITCVLRAHGSVYFPGYPEYEYNSAYISGEECVVHFSSHSCLLGLQYLETYFRMIIMMKWGMSFSSPLHKYSLNRGVGYTLLLDSTFRTETASTYEDTTHGSAYI